MDARTSQMICSTLPTSDMIRCEVVARASWIKALMTRLAIEVSVQLLMRVHHHQREPRHERTCVASIQHAPTT